MGKWSREFSRQLFGGSKSKSRMSHSDRQWLNDRNRNNRTNQTFCKVQRDAAKSHYRDLKNRR